MISTVCRKPESSYKKLVSKTHEITDFMTYLESARTQFFNTWTQKLPSKYCLEDFELIKALGSGSFGHVIFVRNKKKDSHYAMKVLSKRDIIKRKQLDHVLNEKRILQTVRFAFIVNLETCFKDNSYIYLVMPFIVGGDIFAHLKKLGKFEEHMAKFYAAQIILALEYLHFLDLVYRDLKPENILLDQNGYLKVADMGFCKYVPGRTWTICGTPEYIAPEIILCKGYGKAVDWWSFGVLLYEMIAGYTPFVTDDTMKTYENIVSGRYHWPRFFNSDVKDLIRNLLQVDLPRRYGNLRNGINDIKHHKWFRNFNWIATINRKIIPPYLPSVRSMMDTTNFDTKEDEIELKQAETDLYPEEFEDF